MFVKEIDLTNKKQMQDYLLQHFRYHTMNSWNQSTSYANNVKIYNLDFSQEEQEQLYQAMDTEETWSPISDIIDMHLQLFEEISGYRAGFNGRSSGYIVLYYTEYNIQTNRRDCYPGRSIDQNLDEEELQDWSDDELKNRVILVQQFDQMCDDIFTDIRTFLATHEIQSYITFQPVKHRKYILKALPKPEVLNLYYNDNTPEYERMEEFATWLNENGEGMYSVCEKDNNTVITRLLDNHDTVISIPEQDNQIILYGSYEEKIELLNQILKQESKKES